MNESALTFDRKKHICYSKEVKAVILSHLSDRFSESEIKRIFEKIQYKYVDYLAELPYLGAAKCKHNGVGGTYDCIAILAYYEVLNREPSLEEIFQMNNEVFLPSFQRIGKIFNCNYKISLKILHFIFRITAKKDKKLFATMKEGYIMKVEPFSKENGVKYRFERCPLAEFAKKYNLQEIMPAFCNGDYPAMELLHAKLIRNQNCVTGKVCDYQIVGNQSAVAEKHPQKKDEKGYWYNEFHLSTLSSSKKSNKFNI